MCLTLGLHRKSSVKSDTHDIAEAKRHVFWMLYTFDKNVSLNLGRASNFQDYDIDAEYFAASKDPRQRPWDIFCLTTFDFAQIQGQVYDRLYSASALQVPPEERRTTIDELAQKLLSLPDQLYAVGSPPHVRYITHLSRQQIEVKQAYYREYLEVMLPTNDFILYSVLTVIYQASPSPPGTTEISYKCYDAAKRSLQSHLSAYAPYRNAPSHDQLEYINW
jgi:hypothetical protein